MTQGKKYKVFITREIENVKEMNTLYPELDISFNKSGGNLNHQELTAKAQESDALITMLCDNVDEEFLNQNKHLKVISNYAVGLNNINLPQATKLQIPIGHTPNVLTHSTAETALMLLLNLSRRFSEAQNYVRNDQWKTWEPLQLNGDDLRNKKFAIIGFGRIGQDFAAKVHALWGCEVMVLKRNSYNDLTLPFPYRLVDIEEIQANADVLSLHCPLTEETNELIDQDFISSMKKQFYFINTARGAIHNEDALLHGLKQKQIKGIGLDVTNPEPMAASNPLLEHRNVIVIPHIGSATNQTRSDMTKMCFENVVAGLKGEKLPFCAFS
jgi:glyoxylate reductase